VPIDGLCVRIGAMRCHSQAVTIKLKRRMMIAEIERVIEDAHEYICLVPNEREASLAKLTPAAVTGTLEIAVGRLRHLAMGEDHITAFTVGDQLLWGAAEPLRRMLRLLIGR
jgi:aspartate-semialdehyde dehydrogenase